MIIPILRSIVRIFENSEGLLGFVGLGVNACGSDAAVRGGEEFGACAFNHFRTLCRCLKHPRIDMCAFRVAVCLYESESGFHSIFI